MKIVALHGSLCRSDKSIDQVTLSLDRRSESLVKRLVQQIGDLQETVDFFKMLHDTMCQPASCRDRLSEAFL